jgi:asparagine synthase (glutamine-hydrolysing)
MCGIFGLVDLERDVTPERTALVERGTALLKHRGPDGHAVLTEGRICFGHRRLSIVDVEGGLQPMRSTDRRGVIAYNGEVYNFEAIEQEMRGRGRTFSTRSDTEGVLNAYLTWGADAAVAKLRGMFAFARSRPISRRSISTWRGNTSRRRARFTRASAACRPATSRPWISRAGKCARGATGI